MRKILLLLLIISLASCGKQIYTNPEFFQCNQNSNFQADSDKKQLIFEILKRAVVEEKDIPDYHLISDKQRIYIVDDYYETFWGEITPITSTVPVPSPIDHKEIPTQIGNVNFCIKSKPELQNIANKTDDFLYLTIGSIEISENTAKIGLSNGWISSKKNYGKIIYLSGGGYILTFKKENGKWIYDKNASHKIWIS